MQMDSLTKGFSQKHKLRFAYVDVTDAARELEQRHLSGPTAGRILAEGLTAAALLSSDTAAEDERVSLQLQVDGPLGGVLAEATAQGALRGYTDKKIMNEFDGTKNTSAAAALGAHGRMTVICSSSRATLSTGQVNATPPDLSRNLAKYIVQSKQTPAAVELFAASNDGHVRRACGILAERMPDGDINQFVKILEQFNNGQIVKKLESSSGLGDFKDFFDVADLKVTELRELKFHCNCTREKIMSVLSSFGEGELKEMASSGSTQAVTCHFCGKTYNIRPGEIKDLLIAMMDNEFEDIGFEE